MKPARRKQRREPTIALINIVFLMLVFFMVAGALAPPLDRDLKLVKTGELDGVAPPDALVVHPDGTLSYRGDPVADAASYLAARDGDGPVRLVPDRDLPAGSLVALARDLRLAGADRVVIVTERALE
jgi:biopolymer transport protein ExbD